MNKAFDLDSWSEPYYTADLIGWKTK
jgi:hypothetical protein